MIIGYRAKGAKKVDIQFTEMKPRAEKKHIEPKESETYEDASIGKRTFIEHNRKTINEYNLDNCIGNKKRIETIYDMRNGMPLSSLGDKIYKRPDYAPGFFKEGGLAVGSS